jgi:hypothetical protein
MKWLDFNWVIEEKERRTSGSNDSSRRSGVLLPAAGAKTGLEGRWRRGIVVMGNCSLQQGQI